MQSDRTLLKAVPEISAFLADLCIFLIYGNWPRTVLCIFDIDSFFGVPYIFKIIIMFWFDFLLGMAKDITVDI